jgi:4-amino-4-deoxy-L-arabinose transferase-like glycosyltransferase
MRLRAMVWCGVVCLVVVVVVVLWLMCRAESWAEQDVKASGVAVAVAVAAARTWYRTSWAICSGRNHQYRLYLFLLHHAPHRRHAGQAKFTGISNPTT